MREHVSSDKSCNVYKHLLNSERSRNSCSLNCFKIIDSASTTFHLKLKEAMRINWEKLILNQEVKNVNLTLAFNVVTFFSSSTLSFMCICSS